MTININNMVEVIEGDVAAMPYRTSREYKLDLKKHGDISCSYCPFHQIENTRYGYAKRGHRARNKIKVSRETIRIQEIDEEVA
jgi:uncharacterized Zn-finger protein